MFLEIIPGFYDMEGRRSYRPHLKKKFSHPTFPFGRYVSRPLRIQCSNLAEISAFLQHCRQISDKEAFGKDDYWLPPDEFEKLKKGDCDDFALWTWRQLMQMGYSARFVAGKFGFYGGGHAWVTFQCNGKSYIADGTYSLVGVRLPRTYTFKYHPVYSVAWDGKNILFYSHKQENSKTGINQRILYLPEYLIFWGIFWTRHIHRVPVAAFRYIQRRIGVFRR
jgi:hypothetical protein